MPAWCGILFEYLLENEYGLPLARTAAMTSTILLQILFAFSTRVRHTVFERSPFQQSVACGCRCRNRSPAGSSACDTAEQLLLRRCAAPKHMGYGGGKP